MVLAYYDDDREVNKLVVCSVSTGQQLEANLPPRGSMPSTLATESPWLVTQCAQTRWPAR